jgi:hypothetical protein
MAQLPTDCQVPILSQSQSREPQTLAELLAWTEDQAWTTKVLMDNLMSALAHDFNDTKDLDYQPLCEIIRDRLLITVRSIESAKCKVNNI